MDSEFRFFDSRQKYLLFITTTNEKYAVSRRVENLINNIKPKMPALKIFDAGLGDGTLLMNVLRNCHREFPTIPFLVVGKEISMEDVRLTIEKLPDRFVEHPNMVFVVSNLNYKEVRNLKSNNLKKQKKINWETVRLNGNSSFEFSLQLDSIENKLKKNWQVEKSSTGNPTYKDPSVLIIYRNDYEFSLENIIPKNNGNELYFDLILASQPYRSRISEKQKVNYVIKPMIESLAEEGKLVIVHSYGKDAGEEIINKIWPDEKPFVNLSKEIISYLKKNLESSILKELKFNKPEIIHYNLRALPNEIQNGISTSIIFSSWNVITYVGQINDKKVIEAEKNRDYIKYIHKTIKKYDGLSFKDEYFVIEKK